MSTSLLCNLPSFLASLPATPSQDLTAICSLLGLSRQRGVGGPLAYNPEKGGQPGDKCLGLISKEPPPIPSSPPGSLLSSSGGGGDSQTALWPLHLALDWNN